VFYIEVPDRTSGACPANTDPIYRVYDNRADANHRYVLTPTLRATMTARGWIPEGYGPDAVVMCAPRGATTADDVALADPTFYSSQSGGSLAAAADAAAVTHHQLVLNGTTIPYTATTGHLVALDPGTRQPQASMFYVAYTADGQDAATRPVTFFYNGGPGSATVWLHLGSFGPKRLVTGDPQTNLATPFALVDNQESLLDTSDLVFVDAVGAGLSEAVAPFTNQSHWGVDADARVFRDFVQRYVEVNGRGASPKYLFGESYGTTRSAVLANQLEMAGTSLTGVVLQSSVLDYNSNCGVVSGISITCAGYVPSYGSIGAYFGKLNPNPVDVTAYRPAIEAFTLDTYIPADNAWLTMRTPGSADLVNALTADTGLPQMFWQINLNLNPSVYQHNLLAGTVMGRYDARVIAPVGSQLASEDDPSSTFITGSFTAQIRAYLQGELKYGYPGNYVLLSNAINTWNFSHDGQSLPNVLPDLASAMALNPHLKVMSVNGYHDLATPYFQTLLDLQRLPNGAAVEFRTYDGGHMTYLDDRSRPVEKADIRAFYLKAAP
jgi:carboxypeptidase C (cathepsin A)